MFPAIQNLLLAATALGLGSSLTTLATGVRRRVGLRSSSCPTEVLPMAVIPLGWPARPLSPPRRLPVAEKAHRETFGTPW